MEKATMVETRMYKRTSSMEVAYILWRVKEHKAARLTDIGKRAKAHKGKGKAEDESSSHGGSEALAMEGAAGDQLVRDNLAGLETLAMAATELEEGEEAGGVAELDEEFFAAGPQAPEPVLD